MTRELGGKQRHSQALARPKCLIQNALKAHAITDTSNRESAIRNEKIPILTSFFSH